MRIKAALSPDSFHKVGGCVILCLVVISILLNHILSNCLIYCIVVIKNIYAFCFPGNESFASAIRPKYSQASHLGTGKLLPVSFFTT